jgi:hypothetical protein
MTIDWSKPIETVPCDRNLQPVPCELLEGKAEFDLFRVRILGEWFDADGEQNGPGDWLNDGTGWSCTPKGDFQSLRGAVRNAVSA